MDTTTPATSTNHWMDSTGTAQATVPLYEADVGPAPIDPEVEAGGGGGSDGGDGNGADITDTKLPFLARARWLATFPAAASLAALLASKVRAMPRDVPRATRPRAPACLKKRFKG